MTAELQEQLKRSVEALRQESLAKEEGEAAMSAQAHLRLDLDRSRTLSHDLARSRHAPSGSRPICTDLA